MQNKQDEQKLTSIYFIIWTWILSFFAQKQPVKPISRQYKPREPGLHYYDLDENITTFQEMHNYFENLHSKIMLLDKCGNRNELMETIAHFNRQATGRTYNLYIANIGSEGFKRAMERITDVRLIGNKLLY
jgi:hypothetical protein